LTTQQTGVGYPMASLIHETAKIQQERNIATKIVADGGFKKYADVIKALALGADYVMLGSIFNKALESCGETYEGNKKYDSWTEPGERVDQFSESTKEQFLMGRKFYKKFRGMSTKDVQLSLGRKDIKTSEGISKMQPVEYTLDGWTQNFKDYLKSAMSYTDCLTLGEFIGKVRFNRITKNSFDRFNK
jgi:IMP dehydrogenase/GMP reductase